MHTNISIFGPVFALVFWTFMVLSCVGYARIRASIKGLVKADDFRLGESAGVPEHVRLPNRNYMNLLELPQLFYVGCLLIYATNIASQSLLVLAWLYVACRIAHSIVHLTYNNPVHRLYVFAASNITLLVLWIVCAVQLWGRNLA
jgi:hypothetical protein